MPNNAAVRRCRRATCVKNTTTAREATTDLHNHCAAEDSTRYNTS